MATESTERAKAMTEKRRPGFWEYLTGSERSQAPRPDAPSQPDAEFSLLHYKYPRCRPFTMPRAGQLLSLHVAEGDAVGTWQIVAKSRVEDGRQYLLVAPRDGVIECLPVLVGERYAEGHILAMVADPPRDQFPPPEPLGPMERLLDDELLREFIIDGGWDWAPDEINATIQRVGPTHRELPMPEALNEVAPAEPFLKERSATRKATKVHSYSIGEHQWEDLAKLAALAKLNPDFPPKLSEAELVRIALEWVLGLSKDELVERVEENRTREKSEGWGSGKPRTGGRKRKQKDAEGETPL
jgi:hypothetical protein